MAPARLPQVRNEYFATHSVGNLEPDEVVVLRKLSDGRQELLEQELLFADEGLRVLHTETMTAARPLLVWRELSAVQPPGWTWSAEWDPQAGSLRTTEWGTASSIHGRIEDAGGVSFPLALLEELRFGVLREGSFPLVVPQAVGIVRACLTSEPHAPSELIETREWLLPRTVRLSDVNGALLGEYAFDGYELMALRHQVGGNWAVRIEEAEFDEVATRLRKAGQRLARINK